MCDEELLTIKNQLFQVKNRMVAVGINVTARGIRESFLNGLVSLPTIIECMDQYIHKLEVAKKHPATIQTYQKHFNNFKAFSVANKKLLYKITEFNYSLLTEFETWYLQSRKVITANKNIRTIRMILKEAVRIGYLKDDPTKYWEYKQVPEPDKIFLTVDEMFYWAGFPLKSERLRAWRDMFTWMCLTGMYKKDMDNFREENFKTIQGELFIDTERQKNANRYCLPVHPIADEIWKRYKGIWPQISEQKLNKNLKELAFMMGIDKDISIKSGRKTFANYMENLGAEPQLIADMMGHKHFSMTRKHYSNVQLEGVARKSEKLISMWNAEAVKTA